jgi:hypothetical protein
MAVSWQNMVDNSTWVSGYYFCPEADRQCGYQTDMGTIHTVEATTPRGRYFVDDFQPLQATHYVCKTCVGV